MEIKKSPKADLEGKKTTGLLIGLVLIWQQCSLRLNGPNVMS